MLLSNLFAAEEYAKKRFKNSLVFFAEKSGGIDLNLIADDLLSKARELMSELSQTLIILFATNLMTGCLILPNSLLRAMKIHRPNSESKNVLCSMWKESHTGPLIRSRKP
jgi:hypothetical protein